MSDPLISVKIDNGLAREAFLRFPREFERIVDPELSQGAGEVANIARLAAPKFESLLTESIKSTKVGPLHYEVATGVNYARAVEEGVKGPMPHPPGIANGLMEWIAKKTGVSDPKKLSRLAFAIGFSMQMKGIRAQPYMAPAAEKGQSLITKLVQAAVAQSVKEIFG